MIIICHNEKLQAECPYMKPWDDVVHFKPTRDDLDDAIPWLEGYTISGVEPAKKFICTRHRCQYELELMIRSLCG